MWTIWNIASTLEVLHESLLVLVIDGETVMNHTCLVSSALTTYFLGLLWGFNEVIYEWHLVRAEHLVPAEYIWILPPAFLAFQASVEGLFLCIFLAARHVGPLFPDQGSNPCPLQWKCGVLTTGPPGTRVPEDFSFGKAFLTPRLSGPSSHFSILGHFSHGHVTAGLLLCSSPASKNFTGKIVLIYPSISSP